MIGNNLWQAGLGIVLTLSILISQPPFVDIIHSQERDL